jgi:hypothetical protein
LIELLVMLAVLALVAAMLLPAMAGTKRNSTRVQCLANLRQIGVGCAVYANEFTGWYPIVTVGSFNSYPTRVNNLTGIHYTRYFYTTSGAPDGTVMPKGYALGAGIPYSGFDQNLGYLYGGGMVPDAHAFYCPAFSDMSPSSPLYFLNAEYYSTPQLPSVHGNASIRSSYMFNPRMKSATSSSNADVQRKYQKVTDCKQIDVFTIDYLSCPGAEGNNPPGVPFTPDNWAHWPGQGLQALMTDGSVRFCTITNTIFNGIVNSLLSDESGISYVQYNTLFNALRDAP